MASIATLFTFLVTLVVINPAHFQGPATQQSICEFPANRESWFATGMPGFTLAFATDLQPRIAEVGYQNVLLSFVPGALADSYICGAEAQCELAALNANCNENPPVATILKAMANWSNYWQSIITKIKDATASVGDQAVKISDIFNPNRDELTRAATINQPRAGIIIGQFFFAILSIFPPVENMKDGLSVVKELAGVSQGLLGTGIAAAADPILTARFDEFGDILASIGALRDAAVEGLSQFIRDRLNDKDVFGTAGFDGSIVNQIEQGDFAAPVGDLGTEIQEKLTVAIISPTITKVWEKVAVVVIKYGRQLSPDNPHICDEPQPPNSQTFCDEEGNAFTLRRVPPNLNDDEIFGKQDAFSVPGIDNLADFGLSVEAISRSSVRNQALNGYYGVPQSDEEFVQQLVELDLLRVGLNELVFFNIPVCDLNAGEVVDFHREVCASEFPDNITNCIINIMILCFCPTQRINDQDWPFDTLGALICWV